MGEKKSSNLTVRLDPAMVERLEAFESTTPLGRAEITRQALDALLRHFERTGSVVFPLQISDKPLDLNDSATEAAVKAYLEKNEASLLRGFAKRLQDQEAEKTEAFLKKLGLADYDNRIEEFDKFWSGDHQYHFIPLMGGVSAGEPVKHTPKRLIPARWDYPDSFYALRVFGSRMDPLVTDGSIINVQPIPEDKGSTIHQGIVVVEHDGALELYMLRRGADEIQYLRHFDVEGPPPPSIEDVKIKALLFDIHTQRPAKFGGFARQNTEL